MIEPDDYQDESFSSISTLLKSTTLSLIEDRQGRQINKPVGTLIVYGWNIVTSKLRSLGGIMVLKQRGTSNGLY